MATLTLWTKDLFRVFLRTQFKDVKINNDECDEISKAFMEYLQDRCTAIQLLNFVPENEIDVMLNTHHPFRMNGFHPAFIYHFTEFIDQQKKQILNQ